MLGLLDDARDARVVCIQAPGGYGKTTAMADWVAHDPRPTVWLAVRPAAADVHWLAQALLDGLAESGLTPGHVTLGGSVGATTWHLDTLPLVENLVSRAKTPFVLVIDDANAITGTPWECLVESVASSLPAGSQLVIATRDMVPATLWRLQSRGQVSRVGPKILAFDETETTQIMRSLQVRISPEQVRALTASTEGWPVAVYLAGLAMRSTPGAPPPSSVDGTSGLREYLREDVVRRLPPEDAAFLSRVSVLALLDGRSCDEVAGTTNSLARLRRLASVNQLLVAQDEAAAHFRMHPLLADVLSAQLHESDPAAWRGAHAAASHTLERRGDLDGAVHHAKRAGDDALLAQIVWGNAPALLGKGRWTDLRRWLEGVDEDRLRQHACLALSSAWEASHEGDIPRMSRLALAAAQTAVVEDSTCVLDAELLDAAIGAGGLAQVEAATRAFIDGRRRDNPWQTLAHYLLGVALYLRGESSQGVATLVEGHRLATALDVPLMAAHCLAGLADAALADGEKDNALSSIRECREIVARYGLDTIATTAPIFTTSAVGYTLEGRFVDARREATRALRLTALMNTVAPWHAVQGRLALAQVNASLGDPERGRVLLDEAGRARGPATASPRLDLMYEQTRLRLAEVSTGLVGASSLTTAEVRVLQYLPTHLSFPEVADELLVSRHTVKTQALSAYRKLGVHSRSEAIACARAAGLLPPG